MFNNCGNRELLETETIRKWEKNMAFSAEVSLLFSVRNNSYSITLEALNLYIHSQMPQIKEGAMSS